MNTQPNILEVRQGDYLISTDPSKLDLEVIHQFLSQQSYWATDIPMEIVRKALENSLNFGLYQNGRQIGLVRVISDYATFAFISDVFILPEARGQGLSKWLLSVVLAHPSLQGLRRWSLVTTDAHSLYTRFGFTPLQNPERHMEIFDPEIYTRQAQKKPE
jgi:N-acetylglutamate synthase-like GNAT family acetyltransferase